ncbi:ABC transporter ATP-binding protein [Intrasporangium calvum]|uniref:ABC transporter ATP-binding protein n=1 Tax=Intrasporangium calvum TaxID=53358 RepID=A0ABT5GFB4_9MICO|nr:ABC transporter ATP-binding protein [Intrasporangium calvum]MDC5696520.1 ABC transporter ATP-binding protein [Intrasporangium calvum]
MTAALSVKGVSFSYGRAKVLRDVSLSVAEGEIVTVIGPNGAGKSTLLNVIARSHRLRHGDVALGGKNTAGMRQSQVVREGCVLVPEGRQVFTTLSVSDNLVLGGYTRRKDSRTKQLMDEVYAYFPRLAERSHQLAGTLSGGEQQMLAVGRAYMSQPRVMLLDEPSLGLSPQMTAQVMSVLAQLRAERNLTVVVVEQNALAALSLADRGYLLSGGQVMLEGTAEELRNNPMIQHIYLGGAPSAEPVSKGIAEAIDHGQAEK